MKAMNAARASGEASAAAERFALLGDPGLERAQVAAQEPARRHERRARLGRERGCFADGVGEKRIRRNDGVDEAELERRLGVERFGEQEEFRSLGPAEALRRKQRGSGLGNEAEIDERHVEPRGRRRIDEVAMEAQRRPDADRQAVDGGDQRLFEVGEPADEPRGGKSRRGHARRPRRPRESRRCRCRR